MLDWQDFDTVFQQKPDFAFDNKTVESILKHRKEFGDQLFFDRIWKSIGLTRREYRTFVERPPADILESLKE